MLRCVAFVLKYEYCESMLQIAIEIFVASHEEFLAGIQLSEILRFAAHSFRTKTIAGGFGLFQSTLKSICTRL